MRILIHTGLCATFALSLIAGPLSVAASADQTAGSTRTPQTVAQAKPVATGAIAGTATNGSGQILSGVTISVTGPTNASAITDDAGTYAVVGLAPGLYRVTASKPGYTGADLADFAVLANSASPLNVTLNEQTLSSIREIGRVTVNSRRSGFNTGPASVATLTTQSFTDQVQPQVQRVLDQTPGIVIDHPGTSGNNAAPGAISFPSIRGALGFETATLIDGHPLAVGTFGDYVTTFLNSYTLQNVEIIKGPGAAAPEVNYAIGGTVNFRTREPTRKPTGNIIIGTDSFGGVFSNFLYSGTTTNGKLGWVLQYAVNGTPGPLNQSRTYGNLSNSVLIDGVGQKGFTTNAVANAATNGIQNNPLYGTTTLLSSGLPVSTTYDNKSELAKLRYNFSSATTATVSYLGSQTWTEQNGNHLYQFGQQFVPGAGYTGPLPAGNYSTYQNVFYPDGEWEINNEPIFQAEVRTTLKNDVILARWYSASINRLQYNALNGPNDSYSNTQTLWGTFVNAAGSTVAYNGTPSNLTFVPTGGECQNAAGFWTACAAGTTPLRYTSPVYFRSTEEDKLHGASFEYDHFLGDSGNVVSFAYDRTNFNTHSYDYDSSPLAPTIPAGSKQQFQTFLLRGIFNLGQKFNLTVSNYINQYSQTYSTNKAVTAAQAAAFAAANPGSAALIVGAVNPGLTFTTNNYSHYDGRVALTFRPSQAVSLRAAAGSAIAPPYLSLLSAGTTTPVFSADGTSATNTVNGGTTKPETSMGYDIGGDFRLTADGQTVFSADVYRTELFNQFVTAQFANGTVVNSTTGATVPLFSSTSTNLSRARYEGIEASLKRDPAIGFGYTLQGALIRAYPYDISPCFYSTTVTSGVQNCTVFNTNLGIINGVNFQNSGTSGSPGTWNAVSNHSEPYAQGYAEIRYRFPRDGYMSFGYQYYGNNNSLNVPAFFVGNLNARLPIGNDNAQTWIAMGVDNLFGAYSAPYDTAFGGVGVPLLNGKVGLTNAGVIGPRNIRFSLTKNIGGQ